MKSVILKSIVCPKRSQVHSLPFTGLASLVHPAPGQLLVLLLLLH